MLFDPEILAYQEIPISHSIFLSSIIFVIGIFGVFCNRKNVISFLLAIELILLAANINFISFSNYLNDLSGQIFVMFILAVAAAEIAIGLAILIVFFRQKETIDVESVNTMKN